MKRYLWAVLFLAGCVTFGASPLPKAYDSINFSGDVFVNAVDTRTGIDGNFWTVMSDWILGDEVRTPDKPLETIKRTASDFETLPESGLRITWFGHSTLLVEIDGKRVLTDPIWCDISPPAVTSFPRFFDTPMAIEDLPPIDVVVISHDHYDHLDFETTVVLAERGTQFVVPLGVGAHLRSWEVADAQIVELDWWDTWSDDGLVLTATPARHFSGRALNANKTLWSSWSIAGPKHRVYFGGDTGMTPQFKEIGERLGPFDVTLMPIGAYNPSWADIHLNPEEAVKAHQMVRGKFMLPTHWATFELAIHDWFEPANRLMSAAAIADIAYSIPKPGQSIDIGDLPKNVEKWW